MMESLQRLHELSRSFCKLFMQHTVDVSKKVYKNLNFIIIIHIHHKPKGDRL